MAEWKKIGYVSIPTSKKSLVVCTYGKTANESKTYGIINMKELKELITNENNKAFIDIVQLVGDPFIDTRDSNTNND
ncbi:MAG: hypothetical protein JSW14_06420 [Candidatus Bathyarchaeum sp.]|nr:MAG: hypothetical protein JSW14_06420 [Candidatus Bathyarchaeum sp.]